MGGGGWGVRVGSGEWGGSSGEYSDMEVPANLDRVLTNF